MKALIARSSGEVAEAARCCVQTHLHVISMPRLQLNVADALRDPAVVENARPNGIRICAGYPDVDRADDEIEAASSVMVERLDRAGPSARRPSHARQHGVVAACAE